MNRFDDKTRNDRIDKDILKMAQKAGGHEGDVCEGCGEEHFLWMFGQEALANFFYLAQEAEKEACAQVCDALPFLNGTQCATAIRMRGDVSESRQPQTSNEGT